MARRSKVQTPVSAARPIERGRGRPVAAQEEVHHGGLRRVGQDLDAGSAVSAAATSTAFSR